MFLQILSLPVTGHWELGQQLADAVSQWRQRHGHAVLRIDHSGAASHPWYLQDLRYGQLATGVSAELLNRMLKQQVNWRSDIVLTASGRCQLSPGLLPDHTVIVLALPELEAHQWLHVASLIRHLRLRDRRQPITLLACGQSTQNVHQDTLKALERSLTVSLAYLPDHTAKRAEAQTEQLCRYLYESAGNNDLLPLMADETAR